MLDNMKCYICRNNIVKGSNHIHHCAKKNGINKSKNEIKFENYKYNYPDLITSKESFKDIYESNSLPDFKNKYNMSSHIVLFILDYYGIEKRNISNGQKKIGLKKTIKTNLKKYGKKNVLSKGTKFYHKRNETVKQKYGVSNVFQLKSVIEKCNTKEAHEKTAIGWKKWYNSLSTKEKNDFLDKTINSDVAKDKVIKGYNRSSIEDKISEILDILEISYDKQFKLKPTKRNRYYYDFYLKKYNLIIEVNGDYWHANPSIYRENDTINYIYGERIAKDIWDRDNKKNDFAKSKKYDLIVIWESEMKNLDFEKLKELLILKLKNYEKGLY